MSPASGGHHRVVVLSPRGTDPRSPALSPHLEFEDLIVALDDAELVAPRHRRFGSRLESAHNRLAKSARGTGRPAVAYRKVSPEARSWDLLFALFLGPDDVLSVEAVDRWRERSGVAIAWVIEAWRKDLDMFKAHWEVLSRFDHVFVTMEPCVVPFQHLTGRPSYYLPYATDALLFAPRAPGRPTRSIDVLSIGRRSEGTHQHLLREARAGRLFYQFDSIRASWVKDHPEHRFMYASLAQRTRFFVANRSLIGSEDKTGGQEEFGGRFFDAAAAGAIPLGVFPHTARFREAFDWPHFGVEIDVDADPTACLLELLEQPEVLDRWGHRSIVECLGRHDWLHRWETILEVAGLDPTPAMQRRRECLAARRTPFAATLVDA